MSKNPSENGSPVTQLEFGRHLKNVETSLKEIKDALRDLDVKVDKISEEKIPALQIQGANLSAKQKGLIGIFSSIWGIAGGILVGLGRALVGL